MIDRTSDFWSSVKVLSNLENKKAPYLLNAGTLQPKTSFGKACKLIVSQIKSLQRFVNENKHKYVGGFGHTKLSEKEKDEIDEKCMKLIAALTKLIENLKEDFSKSTEKVNYQTDLHQRLTMELVTSYFRSVCQVYNDVRKIRVKEIIERKKFSRLDFSSSKLLVDETSTDHTIPVAFSSDKFKVNVYEDSDDEDLDDDDKAQLAEENLMMLSDLNNVMDEVKVIEGKVAEISKLQHMFNEQVYQQDADIDVVAETMFESSQNIKDGNDSLRQALNSNASYRLWILFFLLMCSFCLLFLEWYS